MSTIDYTQPLVGLSHIYENKNGSVEVRRGTTPHYPGEVTSLRRWYFPRTPEGRREAVAFDAKLDSGCAVSADSYHKSTKRESEVRAAIEASGLGKPARKGALSAGKPRGEKEGPGWNYGFRLDHTSKVGETAGHPDDRVGSGQTWMADDIEVVWAIWSENRLASEKRLHALFDSLGYRAL